MIVRTSQRGAAGHGVRKTPVFTKTNCEKKTWILLKLLGNLVKLKVETHAEQHGFTGKHLKQHVTIGICKESYVEGADALLVEYGGLDVPFLQSNL